MGNVPFHRRLIRRLTRNSSGTLSVSIPIEHASELGWRKGHEVTVEKQGDRIVIGSVDKKNAGKSWDISATYSKNLLAY